MVGNPNWLVRIPMFPHVLYPQWLVIFHQIPGSTPRCLSVVGCHLGICCGQRWRIGRNLGWWTERWQQQSCTGRLLYILFFGVGGFVLTVLDCSWFLVDVQVLAEIDSLQEQLVNVKKVCASSWSFAALRCDGHVPCLVPVGFLVEGSWRQVEGWNASCIQHDHT